ncbi:MAG TPA: alpha/beta hydrolase [Rhizomicrobium sp.]|nr:alpha/beta hydrolase [Rhizomicrobium sp.]
MRSIDYEAEFNARAMVPEHPAIFERWARDAAAHRAEAGGVPELAYGDTPRQAMDVFGTGPGTMPVAMFIHGGWWRAMDRSQFSHMARGLNAHGIAVAVAGYDLCPQVSIAEIVAQMRRAVRFLAARTGRRVVAFGHSAGGHLAATLAATEPSVAAGYAISGVFDLLPLLEVSMNADFRLDAASARTLSPLYGPKAQTFDCAVGALESNAFKLQSRALSDAWAAPYVEIEGANHFTVLDPLSDPNSAMVARLAQICATCLS